MKAREGKYMFVLLVLVIVAGVVALFSEQTPGKAIQASNVADSLEEYDDVTLPVVYCGMIPLGTTTIHLDKYTTVGKLRRAVRAAELQSTLQLPIACAFDCGLRLLPATNEKDFVKLMTQTNFGESLDTLSCSLPFVQVRNGAGQEVHFG